MNKKHMIPAGLGALLMMAGALAVHSQDSSSVVSTPKGDPMAATRQAFQLSVEVKLFRDLADEHAQRAEEARKGDKAAQAEWEANLEKEFRARMASAEKAMQESTPSGATVPALAGSAATGSQKRAEAAYLGKLDDRQWEVAKELSEAVERAKVMAEQVQTNTSPDAAASISYAMQDNARVIRELQREQWFVEMKKLEFQALGRGSNAPAR